MEPEEVGRSLKRKIPTKSAKGFHEPQKAKQQDEEAQADWMFEAVNSEYFKNKKS